MRTETVDFGFIYDTKKQQQVFKKMTDHFRELSEKHKIRIILFSLENLDMEQERVNGTTITGMEVRQEEVTLPPLIYNFAMHYTRKKIETMRNLRKIEGVTVINPINRFIQGMIFEMLTTLTGSQQFLLPTTPFNEATMTEYLKYHTLFLLPEKAFHQPKAVMIQNFKKDNCMIYIGQNGQICRKEDLLEYLKKMINNKKYILMKGIKYIRWGEGPLEARVYLQKGADGKWSSITIRAKSGMFAREDFYDTTINDMLNGHSSIEGQDLEQTVTDISLRICTFLDFHIPLLGSCTIDYILDEKLCPYLVYVGGFEQNSYLYLSMDPAIQTELLDKAFYYLLFLMNDTNGKR